jgi:hypothetical protein
MAGWGIDPHSRELLTRYADNLERQVFDPNRFADYRRVASQLVTPKIIAKHSHLGPGRRYAG